MNHKQKKSKFLNCHFAIGALFVMFGIWLGSGLAWNHLRQDYQTHKETVLDLAGYPESTPGSAQLLVKISNSATDADHAPGDIIAAYNSKQILEQHAQNLIQPADFGFNEHGLREPGTLLDTFLRHTKQYIFERISESEVRRTDLTNNASTVISNVPNENDEQMDVAKFITRRVSSFKHQIFGEPGKEYWYGGDTVTTNESLDVVWDAIETTKNISRADYQSIQFTSVEKRDYRAVAVTDFSDEESARLASNYIIDGEDSGVRRFAINVDRLKSDFGNNKSLATVSSVIHVNDKQTAIARANPNTEKSGVAGVIQKLDKKITTAVSKLVNSLRASAAGTVTVSIGTRGAENVDIVSVTGSGPYTVNLSGATVNTAVGDVLTDELSSPNTYLITAIVGNSLTVRDAFGVGTAPSLAAEAQATTTRAYSTLAAWEAALDDTPLYASGDTAVGELYSDSVFTETIVSDGGATVGLAGVTLQPAQGHGHDGTAGTGVVIDGVVAQSGSSVPMTVIGLDVTRISGGTGNYFYVYRNIVHGYVGDATGTNVSGIRGNHGGTTGGVGLYASNNIVYDIRQNGGGSRSVYGIYLGNGTRHGQVYNSVAWNIKTNATGDCMAIGAHSSNKVIKNSIAGGCQTGTTALFFESSSAAMVSHNISDDASATGTGSIPNQTGANLFVSTVEGSEDFHLKDGSPAIDKGVDLGTTFNSHIDINGYDRNAGNNDWDIGAHEHDDAGVQTKVGTFSLGSTVGTVFNIDVGFEVKYAYFWSLDIRTEDGASRGVTNMSFGVAKSATERYSITGRHTDGSTSSNDSGGIWRAAWAIKGSSNASPIAILDNFTPTPNGFNVQLTKTDSAVHNSLVSYMAFGGRDIVDVHVGSYLTKPSTGVQDYTPLTFEPDYIMSFTPGAFSNEDSLGAQNIRYFFGHFVNDGLDSNAFSAWSAEDGANTMNTASRQGTGKGLLMLTPNNGTPLFEASFNGFLPNGFSLNYTRANSTVRRIPFVAVKGIRAQVSIDNQKTSTGTQSKTGVGFAPKGLWIQSDGAATDENQTDHIVMAMGATDGITNNSWIFTHQDAVPDSVVTQGLDQTKAIHFISQGTNTTTVAAAELYSFDPDGYTLNWTTADSTGREMVVVSFGDYVPPHTITISGSLYSGRGSSPMLGSKTIKAKVNGYGDYTTVSSSGTYTLSEVGIDSGGQVITVYLDDQPEKAVTITVSADTESDITGLDLYRDYTILEHESDGVVTAAMLSNFDISDDADLLHYGPEISSFLTAIPGSTLLVSEGVTLIPGANIIADSLLVEGTLTTDYEIQATSLTGDGAVTSTGPVVHIESTGRFGTSNTWSFNKLLFGGATKGTTMGESDGVIIVNDTLVIGYDHTFNAGELTLDIRGEVTNEISWWNTNWGQRRKIMLDNQASTENLIDFPVLVVLDLDNIGYSGIQELGQDLRFVDADDDTLLDYEIEYWNTSGPSYVWVKVPQINAASNTDFIYMYYNNPGATDAQSPTEVWDTHYRAVYHMNQDPSGSAPQILDSTSAANNGTTGGSMTSGQIQFSKVGSGLVFDGSNDLVNLGTPADLNDLFDGGSTFSTWIYLNGWGEGDYGRLFDKYQNTGTGALFYVNDSQSPNKSLRFAQYTSASNGVWDTPAGSLSLGAWYHVALTYNTTQYTTAPAVYINGVPQTLSYNGASMGAILSDSGNVMTLANNTTTDRTFNGSMDEVRFAQTVRSAEWIEAEYNWMNNPKIHSAFTEMELRPEILPFSIYGSFAAAESTVKFTTYDSHIVTPATYHNLVLDQPEGQFIAEDSFVVTNDFVISAGSTLDLDENDPLVTAHNVTIAGTLVASDEADLVVTGDFTNFGTFTHNNGTVVFAGSDESVVTAEGESLNIFYNFSTSEAGGKVIKFESDKPTKFEGELDLSGTEEGALVITSTASEQWQLWAAGSIVMDRVIVINAGCYEGTNTVSQTATVLDGGNNDYDCWSFVIRGGALVNAPTDGGTGSSGAVSGGAAGGGGAGTGSGNGGSGTSTQQISFVQVSDWATGNDGTTLVLENVTAGNMIIVAYYQTSSAIRTHTISGYQKAVALNPYNGAGIFYKTNVSGGAHNIVLDANTNGATVYAVAMEVANASSSSPLVGTGSVYEDENTLSHVSSDEPVPTVTGGLVVTVGLLNSSTGAISPGSGFIMTSDNPVANSIVQYKVVASAGTDLGEFTNVSTARRNVGAMASFKPSSASAGGGGGSASP